MSAVLKNTATTVLTAEVLREIAAKLPQIEYKAEWANGTGYFNGACQFDLQYTAAFTDDTGRVGIIHPVDLPNDRKGNIVIFQRDGSSRVCANVPLGYNNDDEENANIGKLYDGKMTTNGFTLSAHGRWYDYEDLSNRMIFDLDTLLALS